MLPEVMPPSQSHTARCLSRRRKDLEQVTSPLPPLITAQCPQDTHTHTQYLLAVVQHESLLLRATLKKNVITGMPFHTAGEWGKTRREDADGFWHLLFCFAPKESFPAIWCWSSTCWNCFCASVTAHLAIKLSNYIWLNFSPVDAPPHPNFHFNGSHVPSPLFVMWRHLLPFPLLHLRSTDQLSSHTFYSPQSWT